MFHLKPHFVWMVQIVFEWGESPFARSSVVPSCSNNVVYYFWSIPTYLTRWILSSLSLLISRVYLSTADRSVFCSELTKLSGDPSAEQRCCFCLLFCFVVVFSFPLFHWKLMQDDMLLHPFTFFFNCFCRLKYKRKCLKSKMNFLVFQISRFLCF